MAASRAAEDERLRRAVEEDLGAVKVRMDAESHHAFATDASPCVVEPRAVVAVRSEEGVIRVLRVARNLLVPITPCASRTSLSGAAIGPGIVLDTSGFRRIREFSAKGGWVRVEPGILLSELNAFLEEKGVRFVIDPGSLDLCRLRAMVVHVGWARRAEPYVIRKSQPLSPPPISFNRTSWPRDRAAKEGLRTTLIFEANGSRRPAA